nr:uncharacterized protein LOC104105716 [Nicotiana tomentosiformis]
MPGLRTDIVSHQLPIDPNRPPAKQKPKKFKPDLSLGIKEEVTKYIEAKVVRVTNYPSWLANIVLVPKKDGKIRICVDYRDLNKASPKDDFPLPYIHILIYNCANHELQSFVDCFVGYHQILMHEEDAEKIAFTTPWGVYCYRVMPFGLKTSKDAATKWTEECQKAFDRIKEYFSNPPVLVPPEPGKPFFLYLPVLDNAFGSVLGQHDGTGRKEQAIYYLSKKFTPCEAKYTLIERSCCALTWIAQKLKHYMLAYTTHLISRLDPLKYIFQKPMPTGNLAKWQIFLSEFDIVFGIPESIITDNVANHNSNLVREICETFRIIRRNSTPYRPQMDGEIETTMRTSTGATPYMLVYNTEAVIPAEVEILSLRVIQQAKLDDAEWIRIRQEQLMLIDEKRIDAVPQNQTANTKIRT